MRSRLILSKPSIFVICILFFSNRADASLIVNEILNSSTAANEKIEFLVVSDLTITELGGFYFGDSSSATNEVVGRSQFDSAAIADNLGLSVSDTIFSGTIITVGRSGTAVESVYAPDFLDPTANDSWNFSIIETDGFSSVSGVFSLASAGDVVWVSSSDPGENGTDVTDFTSAIAYHGGGTDSGGGTLADNVLTRSGTDPSFDVIYNGAGGGFDGAISSGSSLSNLAGSSIDFADSEQTGGTLGNPNGGANTVYINSLRMSAVPEPSTVLTLSMMIVALGVFVHRRKASLMKP